MPKMSVWGRPRELLGFAPCLLEGTREVAMMKMMPNKQRKVRSEAREQLLHLCTEFSGIPF